VDEAEGAARRAADEQLRDGMRIERETRPDGRYVLYFAWPHDGGPDEPDDSVTGAASGDDDV
jgi:hypothetical protein